MKTIEKQLVTIGICVLITMGSGYAQTLSLLNQGTGLSSLIITPGQSFSLDAQVSGITSPAVDAFDLKIASLPAGVSISNFNGTSPFSPSGWVGGPAGANGYDGGNFTGSDITGTAELVEINFTTLVSTTPGNYTINFIAAQSGSQDLLSASAGNISYIDNAFTLDVVPEPGTASLLLTGVLGCLLLSPRMRRVLRFSGRLP
jgi:hypothetical protein